MAEIIYDNTVFLDFTGIANRIYNGEGYTDLLVNTHVSKDLICILTDECQYDPIRVYLLSIGFCHIYETTNPNSGNTLYVMAKNVNTVGTVKTKDIPKYLRLYGPDNVVQACHCCGALIVFPGNNKSLCDINKVIHDAHQGRNLNLANKPIQMVHNSIELSASQRNSMLSISSEFSLLNLHGYNAEQIFLLQTVKD